MLEVIFFMLLFVVIPMVAGFVGVVAAYLIIGKIHRRAAEGTE